MLHLAAPVLLRSKLLRWFLAVPGCYLVANPSFTRSV
jgi:hypothetical protein